MPDPSPPGDQTPLRAVWAREVRTRLSPLRISPAREAEIVDELSQHLDDRYRELTARGATLEEATRLALADFRDGHALAQRMSALRQAHAPAPITPGAPAGHLLGDLRQDLRYAARAFSKQPGFAAAAVLTLALGLAAKYAIAFLKTQLAGEAGYQHMMTPRPSSRPLRFPGSGSTVFARSRRGKPSRRVPRGAFAPARQA